MEDLEAAHIEDILNKYHTEEAMEYYMKDVLLREDAVLHTKYHAAPSKYYIAVMNEYVDWLWRENE